MARRAAAAISIIAMITTQGLTPALAQGRASTYPAQPSDPQILPVPGGPQIQPPRPPYPGGPEVQPPRPVYPGRPEIQPPRPPYPGGGNWQGNYAGTLRCESRNNKQRVCEARTENRVELMRELGGRCRQGSTWSYDRNAIRVTRGCRAEFGYGYANGNYPKPDKDKGPSTGAIIAGVAVAGGLIALLASKKKKKPAETTTPEPATPPTYPPGPPAALSADLSGLPADSRPSVQTCLFEASRQVGVTGGTRLRYDKLVDLQPGNGGWRIRANLVATYPDGDRDVPIYCRATPTKVVQLDFTS